jgi:hypothetical protein
MADVLFDLTLCAPMVENYPYREPSDLESINALRPANGVVCAPAPDKETLRDASGAPGWTHLRLSAGKPIEGIRRDELHPLLKESGNWPMHRYILSKDIKPEIAERSPFRLQNKCYADTISCAPVDDDTNYVVLAQVLIGLCGRDFTPNDVAQVWIDRQPKQAYCNRRTGGVLQLHQRIPPAQVRPMSKSLPGMDRRADPRRLLRLYQSRHTAARRGHGMARRCYPM